MLMIWSEVAPIREVIECSKDACFFVFLLLLLLFFCRKFISGGQRLFHISPETIFASSLSKNLYKD